MSGPMTEDQMPAGVREFREKLRAFNLAVAEWLGLDPAQVFHFDLTEGKEPEFDPRSSSGMTGGEYTRVTWESTEKQAPRVGHVTHGARSSDGDVTCTAELLIDWMDDRERIAAIGRQPSMFTAEDERALHARFGDAR